MRLSVTTIVAGATSVLALVTGRDSSQDPLIQLDYATYKGQRSGGINKFLGMRYARPPLGDLRFRAPRDPLKERGAVDATQHGDVCLPVISPFNIPTNNSEDCLFIDVYTPSTARAGSNLPVMIWLQGGAFIQLFNPNYDGTGLIQASKGEVIVVSFNYRVGPYGFFASEEVRKDGDLNAGLLDQRAALKWVSKHIRAFGGDPDKVTLAGTSVGGGSVLLNMVAYGGKETSLFRAGIAGAVYMPSVYEVRDKEFQYQQLLNATGCASLACIRALPAAKLQEANIGRPFPGQAATPLFPYAPVIDGDLLPARPLELLRQGRIVKKPLLAGTSLTEGTFIAPQANTPADIQAFLQTQFPDLTGSSAQSLDALYQSAPATYDGVQVDVTPLYYRAAEEYGDAAFTCPTFDFSSALSRRGSLVYTFLDHILDPVEVAAGLIVPHTWEVAAVWGPQYATQYVALPGANSYDAGGVNSAMVGVIQAYWTSFIRTGDPNTYKLRDAPRWGQYGREGRVLKLETNATAMEVLPALQGEKCAFWASLAGQTHL